MDCARVLRLLPLHAGGDLGEGKARGVRGHLEGCPSCRRELLAYREALAGARSLRDAPLPPLQGFYEGVRERIRRREEGEFARGRPVQAGWWRTLGAAAAVLLFGALGYFALDLRLPAGSRAQRPPLEEGSRLLDPEVGGGTVYLFPAAQKPPLAPLPGTEGEDFDPRLQRYPAGHPRPVRPVGATRDF